MPRIEDVRRALDKDELDYPALARELGPEALPQLKELVVEDEPRIAPKAAYLAGLLAGPTSHEVVTLAAQSRHDVVRVAAAATLESLPAEQAAGIADRLLSDPDVGVRARALKGAGTFDDATIADRVRTVAQDDPEPSVREMAAGLVDTRGG
jgi:HEAT repeat protein